MVFFCYLLTSTNTKYKNHTYVGFTPTPDRRIRQHNGEIANGAKQTIKKRPWAMVATIYGFPSKISALQFEWAWQNPGASLKTRDAIVGKKGIGKGTVLNDKFKILWEMCSIAPWCHQQLTVNVFPEFMPHLTKLQQSKAYTFPSLPVHIKMTNLTLQEITIMYKNDTTTENIHSEADECVICQREEYDGSSQLLHCTNTEVNCWMKGHVQCFAKLFLEDQPDRVLIPRTGKCPECDSILIWAFLVQTLSSASKSTNSTSNNSNSSSTRSNNVNNNDMSDDDDGGIHSQSTVLSESE